MKYKRIINIVIDSVGAGDALDADKYGDKGANTLKHISESVDLLKIPTMTKLGLSNLVELKGINPNKNTMGYYTRLHESSLGKDTMTGHWEIMGLYIDEPFITFTENGFPKELVDELEQLSGHKFIGNYASSGTEILEKLGQQHIETKALILYTSADSVLQIAACETVIPLEELYRVCEIARKLTLKPEWKVGRVIARPFLYENNTYKRTSNRHDYALKPFGRTVLNSLKDANYDVISIGKINDIFDGEGITRVIKSKSSVEGMHQTIDVCKEDFTGLCFTNLVDFDALWGHRRNPIGYAKELESFDVLLLELIDLLNDDDLLIVTADHGNDPTWTGTDHTRETVPFLAYSPSMNDSKQLDEYKTFSVIAATIADNFNVEMPKYGHSILDLFK